MNLSNSGKELKMNQAGIRNMSLVDVSLSVFRTMESSCLRGYFSDNPFSVVRITYRGRPLSYGISRELAGYLDRVLYESGYENQWIAAWARTEIGLSCWRSGSAQFLQSAICPGPKAEEPIPESVVRVLESRRYSPRSFYLVPPCVAFLAYAPVLCNRWFRWDDTVLRLRAPKREHRPSEVGELLEHLGSLKVTLGDDERELISQLEVEVKAYADALSLVRESQKRINRVVSTFTAARVSKERHETGIYTNPKVYGIEVVEPGDRRFYKIVP